MATPVFFIHGLWLHGSSWGPWVELFRDRGYDPYIGTWPGDADTVEAARANPAAVAGKGVNEINAALSEQIAKLPSPPILIGHSFGGLFVQKLLGENKGVAGIAIDPAQIRGVLPLPLAQLRSGAPGLANPLNYNKAVALTKAQFRYGFGNAVSEAESDELFEAWAIPSPAKPLFDAALANFNPNSPAKVATGNASRGPLLITAGGQDHTVPAVVARAAFKLYKNSTAVTELKEFPDRGHSLAMDGGWKEIADAALDFLSAKGL
jgi:pimeloyl-ACP methyl ester carboxylesterase